MDQNRTFRAINRVSEESNCGETPLLLPEMEPKYSSQIRFSMSLVILLGVFSSLFWFAMLRMPRRGSNLLLHKRAKAKAPAVHGSHLRQWRRDYQPKGLSILRNPMKVLVTQTEFMRDHAGLWSRQCGYRAFWHLRSTAVGIPNTPNAVAGLLCYRALLQFRMAYTLQSRRRVCNLTRKSPTSDKIGRTSAKRL